MTSGMLSCHPPSLPDVQSQPVSRVNSKPLVVPAQNYALMQVAGQEGTFSLVALPQVNPAMTAQQIQQHSRSLSENLKLPIPRYQPTRNKKSEKKMTQSSTLDVSSKILTLSQMSTQAHLVTSTAPSLHSEIVSNRVAPEQVILIEPSSTEITVATLLTESSSGKYEPPSTNKAEIGEASNQTKNTIDKHSSEQVHANNSVKQNIDTMEQNEETTKESAIRCEKCKPCSVDSTNAVTVLSPSIFGNAVQLIPSAAPKGKLPILPYSKTKSTVYPKPVQKSDIVDVSASWPRSESGKITSFLKTSNVTTKVSDKLLALALTQISRQATCESACCPAIKFDMDCLKRVSNGAAKRRGRKRKLPDEILAFQAKRKKYVKLRENKNSIRIDPQEPKAVTLKKYRSIMPKPVVVQTLAAPVVQTQTSHYVEQKLVLNKSPVSRHFSCKPSVGTKAGNVCQSLLSAVSKSWHKCHVCNHNFQFKHHLQDHLNTHTNRRPYSCRLCRKAYVHSGSLSTHMKLHHSESRLKKLMCCEFCAKVFGHIKVYFGHLKEVHRVLISTETSVIPQEQGDAIKRHEQTAVKVEEEITTVKRENNSHTEEEIFHNQADDVKLLIRCGRCQVTAPTFADMKLHLLYIHGEKIQGRLNEGGVQSSRGSQEELVKHTAHCWKQLNERQNLFTCSSCEEEFYSLSKLRKHLYLHQNNSGKFPESKAAQSGNQGLVTELQNRSLAIQNKEVQFRCKSGFSCILCKHILSSKEELFLHWQSQHNCEDPSFLWTVFSLFFKQDI
ncbi:zinc finger protein 438 isoform X2 [Rhinatrema bivittatum]|nr:zinc finger protein 438 isoform X2 [Rhinatrema bivittatum]